MVQTVIQHTCGVDALVSAAYVQASDLLAAAAEKSRLAGMMNSGNLQAIFGDEIAGIPTETVLAIT